jgi:hypothetical protein
LSSSFPQSGKNLPGAELFFIIGKKDEDLKNWSMEGKFFYFLSSLDIRHPAMGIDRGERN